MQRFLVLGALLAAAGCASVASEPVQEDQYSRAFCTVAGAEESRTGLYDPNPKSDILLELERTGCLALGLGEERPESLQKQGGGFHEHGITLVDGGPILFGKEASNEYFSQFYKAETDFLTWEPIEAHINSSEDMGWVLGLYKFQPEGGDLEAGKFISVYEKVDGQWLIVAEIRNPF